MDRSFDWIMGINPILELLKTHPERIVKVFTENKEFDQRKKELIEKLNQCKIPISFTDKKKLEHMVNSDSHQSFVAKILQREYLTLKAYIENLETRKKTFILVLDQIFDPHNTGAIIRAAECFGIDAVLFSKNRGADITPTVSKSSSGATELIPLIKVSNLHQSLLSLKEEGFEVVIAESKELSKSLYTFKFPEKVAFVVGSEGSGIQPLIRKIADHFVSIPMKGKIDSLNVSQAASIFLAFWQKSIFTE